MSQKGRDRSVARTPGRVCNLVRETQDQIDVGAPRAARLKGRRASSIVMPVTNCARNDPWHAVTGATYMLQ